jgi:hypothetical protein
LVWNLLAATETIPAAGLPWRACGALSTIRQAFARLKLSVFEATEFLLHGDLLFGARIVVTGPVEIDDVACCRALSSGVPVANVLGRMARIFK